MNALTKLSLITAALLTAGATFAAEPAAKTRDQVVAELAQARESGEVAALSAEQAGVGALNNGLNSPTSTQIAARKAADKIAAAKGGSTEQAAAAK